ncbi:MAG TPA: hypothetical protein VIJ79_15215 [Acidobacteriaceae bacterium]
MKTRLFRRRRAPVQSRKSLSTSLNFNEPLKASCTLSGIDDPIFCSLLSRRVKQAVLQDVGVTKRISTESIRLDIFQELDKLSLDTSQLSGTDQMRVRESAKLMRSNWQGFSDAKEGRSESDEIAVLYATECEALHKEVEALSEKLVHLQIGGLRVQTQSLPSEEEKSQALASELQRLLKNKRGLCVKRIGHTTFRTAFERLGLSRQEFERFFDEKECDGKQSNLNSDLRAWLDKFGIVLYAGEDLRHLSDSKVRSTANLVRGYGPNDVIRKLLAPVQA